MDIQEAIIVEAHEWIGTPYKYGAKHKLRGVDCYRLLVGVLQNVGALPVSYKAARIHKDWIRGKNVDKNSFSDELKKYFDEVPVKQSMPGDVLTFKYNNIESHVAIQVYGECMIHACENMECVTKQWIKNYGNICSAYRLKGVDDGAE